MSSVSACSKHHAHGAAAGHLLWTFARRARYRIHRERRDARRRSQHLHGVYVAGALAQLFATQVRDRSVRSLFKQLRLATVQDIERIGMDVDTWEDAAVMERRLAELA